WTTRSSVEGAAQIALFMLAIVFGLILVERWARRRQRYVTRAHRRQPAAPIRLAGWRAGAASGLCLLPVFIGFLVPTIYLAHQATRRIAAFGWPPNLWTLTWNSLVAAVAATAIALLAGLVLAYTARLSRS